MTHTGTDGNKWNKQAATSSLLDKNCRKALYSRGGRLYGSLVRGIPPALDVDAGFPAPFTGGSGRDLATQQGSSDVLCPAHRDACQRVIVHINGKKYSRISAFFVIVRGWTTVFFLC